MPSPLKCPSCAAPLAHFVNSVECPYCGNTVLMPGRTDPAGGSLGSILDQSLKLAEVARLVAAGQKIAAIKMYREVYGVGLKEAKEAVEKIERGEPVTAAATSQGESFSFNLSHPAGATHLRVAFPKWVKTSIWIAAGLFILAGIISAYLASRSAPPSLAPQQASAKTPVPVRPATPVTPAAPEPSFAAVALEFGSEGIGAGQFKDARSVAVDPEGRIYVGEYSGGRIQVFDAQGRFLTQWMSEPKAVLLNLVADRKGIVYAIHPSKTFRYDGATGNLLGEVPNLNGSIREAYSDIAVALDGSLYAIGGSDDIIRISPDGRVKTVVNTREKLGEPVSSERVAVDGTGNMYALSLFEYSVFKFAPDGRFINRFGGRGDKPGQLSSPRSILVDGQGRIYVGDAGRSIQVFDGDGRYLDSFGGREVVFGIALNDQGEIFACHRNKHKVIKYAPVQR
jgi:DNA-binding beta-propeller fold protein YncE